MHAHVLYSRVIWREIGRYSLPRVPLCTADEVEHAGARSIAGAHRCLLEERIQLQLLLPASIEVV